MPIPLRTDFDAATVRIAARKSKDGAQARRLLALAAIYEGASRTEASRIGGVTLQIIRDWVVKFNAADPDRLIDRKAPGQPSLLNATHRAALVEAIERGPIPAVHGVVPLRQAQEADHRSGAIALGRFLSVSLEADVEPRAASARLPQTISAAQAPCSGSRGDRGLQKGGFAAELDKVKASLPRGTPIEIWFRACPELVSGTRRGSDRRTRSRGAGRSAGRGHLHRMTNAPSPPTSSGRYARRRARLRASFCRSAIPRP